MGKLCWLEHISLIHTPPSNIHMSAWSVGWGRKIWKTEHFFESSKKTLRYPKEISNTNLSQTFNDGEGNWPMLPGWAGVSCVDSLSLSLPARAPHLSLYALPHFWKTRLTRHEVAIGPSLHAADCTRAISVQVGLKNYLLLCLLYFLLQDSSYLLALKFFTALRRISLLGTLCCNDLLYVYLHG